MPIRSPHGRAAAYRAVWQWPLRSPARLAVTAVLVIAVIAGITTAVSVFSGPSRGGLLGNDPAARPGTAGSEGGHASSGAAGPTVLPPLPELTPTTLPLAQAPRAALDVAARFTAAWADHAPGTTSERWLAGLRDLTTPELLAQLGGVDPANVPATRVTGTARPVQVAARSVRVEVPTDALTLLVLVVDTEVGWRVAGYDQA